MDRSLRLLVDRLRLAGPFLVALAVRVLLQFGEVGAEDELLLVDVPERKPEDDGQGGTRDGGASECPNQEGIPDGRRGGETDSGGDGRHGQVQGGDEALHVLGRSGVRYSIHCNVHKDLRDGGDDDGDGVPGVGDGGHGDRARGEDIGTRSGIPATRRCLVDVVLQDGVPDGPNSAECETKGYSGDRTPFDTTFTKERVDDMVHERDH